MTLTQIQFNDSGSTGVHVRILPLYDNLTKQLSEKVSKGNFSVTPEYRSKLYSMLSSLTIEQSEQITLLIIHYYFLTNNDKNPFTNENCNQKGGSRMRNLPYGIKISPSGKGFSFDIDKVPILFQALLGMYCSI